MKNDPIVLGRPEGLSSHPFWERLGFRFGDKGTHSSRTIMVDELSVLLHECNEDAAYEDYASAILDDNCLGKKTVATRKHSLRHLRELYGLDSSLLLFRTLRYCWYADDKGRPLLALLSALARDPLLRVTAPTVFAMQPGVELVRQQIKDVLKDSTGDRLNENILDKVVRNASSSWTQSGHLVGRVRKIRRQVDPTPVVTAYAVLLGYLLGARSVGLFQTFWAKALDTSPEEFSALIMDARRLGLLDVISSGGVITVLIDRMLTEDERRLVRGQS